MEKIKEYFFPVVVLCALGSMAIFGVIYLIYKGIVERSHEFTTGFSQGAGAAVGILGLLLILNAIVGRIDS